MFLHSKYKQVHLLRKVFDLFLIHCKYFPTSRLKLTFMHKDCRANTVIS